VEDHWQVLYEVKAQEPNRIEALALVPVDSPWFSGHFPGEPILPGIALINLAWQTIIHNAEKIGEEISLNALRRVRFTRPVRPGENLSLIVTAEAAHEETIYSFKVISQKNTVCSGLIVARKVKKTKKEDVMPEGKNVEGIIKRVAEIIIGELKLEDVTADTFNPDLDLIDELGIDSMDLATIALVLQDEYKIVIDEDDYPKLKTVGLIAEYIEQKLATKN
jgi:acyl carrier protein